MSKETEEKPVIAEPVEEEPCDHKGNLEAVSAKEANIDIPPAVEERLDIFQCKECGEIVITDKS